MENEISSNYNPEEQAQDEYGCVKNSVRRKQRERKIRKKRKKINGFKRILKFILSVVLLLCTYKAITTSHWILPSNAYTIDRDSRIEICNNKIIPDYVVKDAIKNLKVSKVPIYLMRIGKLKKELYKIPVVKNVYIRRYGFPARLQIILTERYPIAIIMSDLKSTPRAFFSEDGILITNKKYMPLIDTKGVLKILTNSTNLKKDIDNAYIKEIQDVVKQVELYSQEKVEYIDVRKPNDVFVKITSTTIRLGALDSTLNDRIKRIYTILPQIGKMNKDIKYVDLSWDKVNYLKLKKVK